MLKNSFKIKHIYCWHKTNSIKDFGNFIKKKVVKKQMNTDAPTNLDSLDVRKSK